MAKSGYTERDIDYLGILHMKRSAHERVLEELGLSGDQTIYLDHLRTHRAVDPALSLELGLREKKIQGKGIWSSSSAPGDRLCLGLS